LVELSTRATSSRVGLQHPPGGVGAEVAHVDVEAALVAFVRDVGYPPAVG
jgi:hypothetical protein